MTDSYRSKSWSERFESEESKSKDKEIEWLCKEIVAEQEYVRYWIIKYDGLKSRIADAERERDHFRYLLEMEIGARSSECSRISDLEAVEDAARYHIDECDNGCHCGYFEETEEKDQFGNSLMNQCGLCAMREALSRLDSKTEERG